MKKQQAGFTLIELVVVIVILGILAATALPRFVDLTEDAELAAVEGFAGAISAGNNINYATFLVRGSGGTDVIDTTAGCSLALANQLLEENLPADYDVLTAAAALAVGDTTNCVLDVDGVAGGPSAEFTLTGAD